VKDVVVDVLATKPDLVDLRFAITRNACFMHFSQMVAQSALLIAVLQLFLRKVRRVGIMGASLGLAFLVLLAPLPFALYASLFRRQGKVAAVHMIETWCGSQRDILRVMSGENIEPVRTGADLFPEWLSVREAVLYCESKGLSRTGKTIRKWAKLASTAEGGAGDIVVRTQDTENNYRWLIERKSLDIKIEQELEYDRRKSEVRTSTHASKQVHTGTERFEPASTGAHQSADHASDGDELERVKELEDKVFELTIGKRASEQLNAQMAKEREVLLERLTHQSHTIGVLETEKKYLALASGESVDRRRRRDAVIKNADDVHVDNHTSSPQGEQDHSGYNELNG